MHHDRYGKGRQDEVARRAGASKAARARWDTPGAREHAATVLTFEQRRANSQRGHARLGHMLHASAAERSSFYARQRRAVLRGVLVDRVIAVHIYARDDWTCQLCGDAIDRAADYNDSRAPTIDHIVPLSLGGTHEPRNVQCAHRECNTLKNARLDLNAFVKGLA
jgi:5-methylcytosine-specific restriction endonuclease McrA